LRLKPINDTIRKLYLLKDCIENHCPGIVFYSSSILLIYDDSCDLLVKLIDFANVRIEAIRDREKLAADSDLIKGIARVIEILSIIALS
jgi:hypothetical protein